MTDERQPRNPLLNDNKLKLGIFGTNGKGSAQTLVPEQYRPTWENSVRTARAVDAAGFEAIVAYARWKGYMQRRPQHPSGIILDPFTWCAGIAQATSYAAVMPTTHAPTMHPILAAKQTATIDIISGGRLALNIVGGWNRPELEMFGAPLREHDERYDHLEEWLRILERLWTEPDEFDFEGRFFKINAGMSMPKPLQQPRPPIMNAGGSGRGMRFAGEHADLCFVLIRDEDPVKIAKQTAQYKAMAREQFGRRIAVWTYLPVVQRDTQKEAEAYLDYYAVENEDGESIDAWTAGISAEGRVLSGDEFKAFRKRFAAGGAGPPLVGTADAIADQLQSLNEAGIDGVLLAWVDFDDGIARFTRDVLPLLEKRGMRRPFAPRGA